MTEASLTPSVQLHTDMVENQANSEAELARRRRNARRTALVLGAVALAIFVSFILSGVFGRAL